MSNMHRIYWFDQQVREGKHPNSRLLSQQFEISTRQAQRDIEYMEISLRAPLMYVAKQRGYCYEDNTYLLPLLYMTDEEKRVLSYLSHRYRSYDYENAASVQRVAHLLERFTNEQVLEKVRLPVFNVTPQILQYFELLTHAIERCLVVHILYREEHDKKVLTGCPLSLLSKFSADYVRVYVFEEQGEMELRLDRIEHLRTTQEKMEEINLELSDERNLPSKTKPFQALIRLREPLSGNSWYGYPVSIIESNKYYINFYEVELFLQELILHMSEWQELLSPKWLREKLRNRCETLLKQLNSAELDPNETLKE